MFALAPSFAPAASYAPLSGASDAEPVIVTPCRASAAIRDRVFVTRCEFAWRSETVTAPSGDGRRTIAYKRLKQTARFAQEDLHHQMPKAGDLVTRSWDGVTFEIGAVYAQSTGRLCDLIESARRPS